MRDESHSSISPHPSSRACPLLEIIMAKLPPLSDEDRENLVAYLDGELDAKTARTLEAKLHLDAEARAEAEALRRTWEMLDYLPRPEPTATFSSRTLERVTAAQLQTV